MLLASLLDFRFRRQEQHIRQSLRAGSIVRKQLFNLSLLQSLFDCKGVGASDIYQIEIQFASNLLRRHAKELLSWPIDDIELLLCVYETTQIILRHIMLQLGLSAFRLLVTINTSSFRPHGPRHNRRFVPEKLPLSLPATVEAAGPFHLCEQSHSFCRSAASQFCTLPTS